MSRLTWHTSAVQRLGPLEAAVMGILWQTGEAMTAVELEKQLAPSHPVTYSTVMTILERLREKGRLERTKEGRSFRYRAVVDAEEYLSVLLGQVLSEAPDKGAVLTHFATSLTSPEVALLRAALRDVDEQGSQP